MANERTCMICGEHYKYCPTCREFNSKEHWKMLFHDEECLDISNVWYAYRGKQITKEQAKHELSKFSDRLERVLENTSVAAKEIRAILDVPEKKEEVVENVPEENVADDVKEEVVEETKTVVSSPISEAAKQSFKQQHHKKK